MTIGINHVEMIVLLLLTLVAALAVVAKRIDIPYPIVLVIGGLVLGLAPHVPRVILRPDVVFLIFLPPLLFSAAFHISWRDFREGLVHIVMLAFGLVGFTVWGVAATTRVILPGFDWKLGLVLGAVVATTDAIAATATAKKLGLPRAISDLLEAESLVNDGSGLLALKFTAAIVLTGVTPTFIEGTGTLLYLIAAGVAIGLAAGFVIRFAQARISDAPIEITISLVAPYVTYLSAEAAHCSGVLATIACGLYLGRRSSGFYSLHARIESSAFWGTLNFILNGIVFLLLGLQLPQILSDIRALGAPTLIRDGALFSGIVILLRLLWLFPGAWISEQIQVYALRKPRRAISPKLTFLVGWAGLRGVLALAAAMSLPLQLGNGQPFPQRSLIIFLTFCVIMATLVLQGLSMPPLIRALGLAGSSASASEEELAKRDMIEAALETLQQLRSAGEYDPDLLDSLERNYRNELELLQAPAAEGTNESGQRGGDQWRSVAQKLRRVERQVALRLRNEDKIHDEVLRALERELDLLDLRFPAAK